ncbi:MAG: ATP-dependent RNA helicase HrpA [Cellvibrionales bacterium]|nr:ATP-dependent RNA helicase HrpA [Cellvibrionales bacterium]
MINKPFADSVLIKDRHYLTKLTRQIEDLAKANAQGQTEPCDQEQKALADKFDRILARSSTLLVKRQSQSLTITYPDLPVSQRQDEIKQALIDNQVVIVAGETGSGKTTQLGKMCLELGRGRFGQIAHTQPRRVAATSVAKRIAEELNQSMGESVSYQVRFNQAGDESSLLKLMTDGMLLAEIPRDRFLNQYDTIIIDEAHERSLNIDFLLGYLKQLLPKRPDLKVIITSATIDITRFSTFFDDAPVIQVEGRTFGVDIQYRPVEETSDDNDLYDAVLRILEEIEQTERQAGQIDRPKDVLVFLSGEQPIRQTSLLLRRSDLPIEVLPLYARLSAKEHEKIFNPPKMAKRRVVLATNVAETSLTVPGIGYVIDTGLARVSRYSSGAKIQRLPIEKIAQANANQRAGRCGRIAEGVCFRLYSEEDFFNRPEFMMPEIQRTNLSQVILQMHMMGLGDIDRFPFIQRPEQRYVNDGMKQLLDLGALIPDKKQKQRNRLTPLGRQMGRLPIDPKLARILVEANDRSCLKEMLIIVAGLATQDPKEVPHNKQEAAREKHRIFNDDTSDFIADLNVWEAAETARQDLSNNQFRKFCQQHFLSFQKLKEWREVHKQLMLHVKEQQWRLNQEPADKANLHKALLTGMAAQIGRKDEKKRFDSTRNRQFILHPQSGLYKKPPNWILVAEMIETTQLYGLKAARIEPSWVIEVAPHQLKYQYAEPHFSAKKNAVVAMRKTSLYGLVLEDNVAVIYSSIDPVVSREIFIRQGLVEEQLKSHLPFYKKNQQTRKAVELLEEKQRRRDLLVSDDQIFAFYDARLPANITNERSLQQFCKKPAAKALVADRSVFLSQDSADDQGQFPSSIRHEDVQYRLTYHFQPGKAMDGVCVRLPVASLNRVPRHLFDWLVPGLLREKCEALLKTLPKQHRRPLVPIPATLDTVMPLLGEACDVDLLSRLTTLINQAKNTRIQVEDFQLDKLEDFYRPLFELRGENNQVLTRSRQLSSILDEYAGQVKAALDKTIKPQKQQKANRWVFGEIEKTQQFKQSGSWIKAYPALEDQGDGVRMVLMDYADQQQAVHRKGLVRLAQLTLPQQVKYLKKELFASNQMQLKLTAEFDPKALVQDVLDAAFNHCFFSEDLPFSEANFEQRLSTERQNLVPVADRLTKIVESIFAYDYDVRLLLSTLTSPSYAAIVEDCKKQRQALLFKGFVYSTPIDYLQALPRYFQSMAYRLSRVDQHIGKEKLKVDELAELKARMDELKEKHPVMETNSEYIQYAWMLQEYRVSLFSQQLKTRYPISRKRLDKQWDTVVKQVSILGLDK